MTSSATDVFISYKAEDRGRLKPLVEVLELEGFSVWWDTHIGGGTNWRRDIEEHLDAAKCVLVAWTKRSVGPEGNFVRDEASDALKRGRYLPILFDDVDPPLGFREVQAISLKGWKGDRSDPRLLKLVAAIGERVTGEPVQSRAARIGASGISRRALIIGGTGIGAVAVAGGGWLLLRPAPASSKRIAVLPFANLSGDPAQAYFSDGIAEELRSSLSRIGMQVIGRTSSNAVKDLDTKTAAAKLEVANILTGSVRRSATTIRIDAQLIGGSDGVERWAQSYDRAPGDTIKIQTDIAENVAQALSIALGQAGKVTLTLGGTTDSVAQDLVLQSRKLSRELTSAESYRQRIALTDAAIARDPKYADAYVEKANALFLLAAVFAPTPVVSAEQIAQGEVAARKAIALAPKLGSAHGALANIATGLLDFPAVLRETRNSIALSPLDPNVLADGARNLALFAHPLDGVALADRAIALDPLNGRIFRNKSEALTYLRHYPEAIETGRKAIALSPDLNDAHLYIGDALLLLGRHGEAEVEYQAIGNDSPMRSERLALFAAATGDRPQAEQIMERIKQADGAAASYQYAQIFTQLGDKEGAFAELQNAIAAKDPGLSFLKVDPFIDPIRSDRRYGALLRKLNFP